MSSWLNSFWDILPFPILIGMFIWTFSMCLFSLCLLLILLILHKRSSPLAQLISSKQLSNVSLISTAPKAAFSCDSLSLISCQTTRNDCEDTISSFYLRNSQWLTENEKSNDKMRSLPSVKLHYSRNEEKQTHTLPQLSTRRSIIKDLTSVEDSIIQKKLHQSIDSLFSKDSLLE